MDNSSAPTVGDGDSEDRPSNPDSDSSMLGNSVSLSPATHSVSGIAISATNYDQVNGFAAGVAASGSAAVALTAVVNAINDDTKAYIGANADVTAPDVSVVAGNDFHHLAVAAALAFSGGGAVAPAVDVTVVTNNTTASIDAGAEVTATTGDVSVEANAKEDMLLLGFALAGATVGVGGAVGVLVVNDTTTAKIAGAVTADDNVVVRAVDTTDVTIVDGALGAGLGGLGVSVGVLSLGKTTEAFVDDGASVHARGNGSGVTALSGTLAGGNNATGFDSTTVNGLVVEAQSSEKVFHLAVAAGGGFVGLAGGITVTSLSSSTQRLHRQC